MDQSIAPGGNRLRFSEITEWRWHLDPKIKFVVQYGDERVEYSAREVFEALKRPASSGGQET